jgi:hypothetical protein
VNASSRFGAIANLAHSVTQTQTTYGQIDVFSAGEFRH